MAVCLAATIWNGRIPIPHQRARGRYVPWCVCVRKIFVIFFVGAHIFWCRLSPSAFSKQLTTHMKDESVLALDCRYRSRDSGSCVVIVPSSSSKTMGKRKWVQTRYWCSVRFAEEHTGGTSEWDVIKHRTCCYWSFDWVPGWVPL